MVRRMFPLLLLTASLSACVTTHAIELGTPGKWPPVDPAQVQVFLAEADVKVPFEKVALIEAEGDYTVVHNEEMLKAMKKKAGKLGANGLILGEFKDPSTAGKVANAVFGTPAQRKASVVAIRLREQ